MLKDPEREFNSPRESQKLESSKEISLISAPVLYPKCPKLKRGNAAMTNTTPLQPTDTGSKEITRFNALRHSVLLHCESRRILDNCGGARGQTHAARPETEQHLIKKLAGILWR